VAKIHTSAFYCVLFCILAQNLQLGAFRNILLIKNATKLFNVSSSKSIIKDDG